MRTRSCRARRSLVAATPDGAASSTAIDVRAIGLAVVELGGGRARAADAIDPAVGLTELAAARRRGRADRAARPRPRARRREARGRRRSACAPPIDSATRRPRAADPVIERIAAGA